MDGPDVFQHSDVILLWNVAALFFVSISTDYWQYKSYDFAQLQKDLNAHNLTGPSVIWHHYKFQGLMVVSIVQPRCQNTPDCQSNFYIYQVLDRQLTDIHPDPVNDLSYI